MGNGAAAWFGLLDAAGFLLICVIVVLALIIGVGAWLGGWVGVLCSLGIIVVAIAGLGLWLRAGRGY